MNQIIQQNTTRTHSLGFPRMGAQRELKRALEALWAGTSDAAALPETARQIRAGNWALQAAAGIDLIPSNDFSYYDQMLDTCALLGAVPARFGWEGGEVGLDTYFAMARGVAGKSAYHPSGPDLVPVIALEMTKWFDTNYHYLVPELEAGQEFHLSSTKPFDEFSEALHLGIRTVPVLIGPVTFLALAKSPEGCDRLSLLSSILPVYAEVVRRLAELGAEWIQWDEPALCLDLTQGQQAAYREAYAALRAAAPNSKFLLNAYFGELRENLPVVASLPVDAVHLDAVRGTDELPSVFQALPASMQVSLGVVDGRNIWRNEFDRSLELIHAAETALGPDRVLVSTSCSLLHVPVSLAAETGLDFELKSWLAFATEKLDEVAQLARLASGHGDESARSANRAAIAGRKGSVRIHDAQVKFRLNAVTPDDARRTAEFQVRRPLQQARLQLPRFPATTIGSFPQTAELRSLRSRFKSSGISAAEYETRLEKETRHAIEWQEEIGLDVLVHGEFERNDMVEYFGENLSGFAFTRNGWVQSYGSRCVKPPIIFGDVSRPAPITVRWSRFAQALTSRPVKGMLTGPITILQWSFVRDDQPRRETARQIALALRDEVRDLEAAGLAMIQIDEPALREGLPLRRADWGEYLNWAVEAFRLTAAGVRDDTQIHTHMCYCEFEDVLASIAALDADVISIETSRSNMQLLDAFGTFQYPNEIGPGVWDIHSPRVPSSEEMLELLRRAARVVPSSRLWVNPDCGLKTRRWAEVAPALKNLVAAAKLAREEL